MNAVDTYILRTKKKILVEYCLMKDINDSHNEAHELGQLLQSRSNHVLLNIIPYNDTAVDAKYSAPSKTNINVFVRIIMKEYGVRTTIRKEMGSDVAAACGQLVVEKNQSDNNSNSNERKGEKEEQPQEQPQQLVDMEDMFGGSGANAVSESIGSNGSNKIAKHLFSRQKLERLEARRGHRAALNRITKSHQELLNSGEHKCNDNNKSSSISYDNMMKLINQTVVKDSSYVPRTDGRPLFPAP
jgi:hypothetical protein